MFKKKFELVQRKMMLELEEIRCSMKHNGNRGSSAEEVVRLFLRKYLASYNRVGCGEIIDINNGHSTQLDVIITNEYHPNFNEMDEPEVFIIEGVSCAGEVKTNLSSKDIDVLINSCITYKSLKPTHMKGMNVHTNESDLLRFVDHRPYFIFSFESQLTLDKIYNKLICFYEKNNIPYEKQIDGVFCLDRGVIWNLGDGKGVRRFMVGNVAQSGLKITNNTHDSVVFDFMTWISSAMPKLNYPMPPINLYLGN